MSETLHPAENRGYRELYAFSRQLIEHWSRLRDRFAVGPESGPLDSGVRAVERMLTELEPLTARYGLHGRPAAQGVGQSIALQRAALRDRFLERGQALRLAVLELQQLTTLLAYLAAVAQSRSDEQLADFCGRAERRLRRVESSVRKAVAELGARPDDAIEPLDPSSVGRAAHSLGYVMGTVGEWVDRRASRRED
jgi:hypothetical protein